MGISGSLKDVSVADVMQFIHLGRRTGTLELARGRERAVIGFHCGRLVSAQAPRTPKLGDLLVSSGLLERGALEAAIQAQGSETERRSLGQILTGSGALEAENLRNMIARQIEQAVSEVLLWETGTFDFAIDDLRPIDDIALYPSDVLPDADINTQMVLLEAARIFDERSRNPEGAPDDPGRGLGDATHPTLLESGLSLPREMRDELVALAEAELPAAPEHMELQVVSADGDLAARLEPVLRGELASIRRTDLGRAGEAAPGAPSPVVLVDLRSGRQPLLAGAAAVHLAHPRASLIAVVDPGTALAPVYAAGFLAAVPPEVEAIAACVGNVIENRRDLVRGAPEEVRSGVARLRRVFGDLRSGLISATVALNLMHIISESVERAVLFLVKRDHLMALGAFGAENGRPLAEVTRGLKISLEEDNALVSALAEGEVQSLSFEQANLPEPFRTLVGRPRNGQIVVFPVLGAQRVISVIYADNGDREEPVEDIDILELATAQVGMAFENELLRRQISQHKE